MNRRRILVALAALYVLLLAASHLARSSQSATTRELPESKRRIETADGITIAYRDYRPPAPTTSAAVVLLHGSPGSASDFRTLAPALANRFRVLAPDLPGFGDSTRILSDYSIRAHAGLVIELLDALAIDTVHVVGFSMGGGVALEMARQAPSRVTSLTLLSSIGVQELELLGDYRLNRAIHGLQLATLTLLHEGVPHFGALDGFPLDRAYARNFFDSDQRPLRGVLGSLTQPTLILHGRHDVLVPAAAALEHHRLVPQSELILLDESHFMVFGKGAVLAPMIGAFLDRAEAGVAPSRQQADPRRLEAAAAPFDARTLPQASGLALVVLMILLAAATFASEDLASIGTGLLVAQGRVGFFAGAAACFAGILVGDVAIYLAGRFLGRPWLGRAPLRWLLSPAAVDRGRRWFARKGPSVIFASRFLPGTRVATYFAAGLLGAGFWRFLLFLGSAVALWVPLIVGISSLLGVRVFGVFEAFSRFALPGVLALAVSGWLLFRTLKALLTWRGRRLLVGRWRRLRRWEFWPPWLFYPPVLLKVGVLGLRHRSLTVFTAANPAIPAGGFIGESKSAILDGIDARFVARYQLLPATLAPVERQGLLEGFMISRELDFPIVLKPDVGQRGSGVEVVRSRDQAARYFECTSGDLLAQEYLTGVELGVFYVRLPGKEQGDIFSITDKRLPDLVGDGTSTVEELILADDRAVAMATTYLDRFMPELDRIPPVGERLPLVDIGTHCLGALFLDGRHYLTAELASSVDEIGRSYDGFFFGRFDLKAPSLDAFRSGLDIRVIELNGVTSEATHVYDPATSLVDAWRTLFRQWELAFEVGRLNAATGARVAPVSELLRLLWQARQH